MLNKKAFALVVGLFAGVCWALMVLLALWFDFATELIVPVGSLHPYFSVSYLGALWMGVLHLVGGYVLGFIFAALYNWFAKKMK